MILMISAVSVSAQDGPVPQIAAAEAALEGQLTLEDISALNDGKESVFQHDGVVTLIDGTCTVDPVTDVDSAAAVAVSMIELLGGDERTELIEWRTLNDTAGNIYYVFQQICGGVTISGGAVKVITDAEGNMIGLSSTLISDLPDVSESFGITMEEAIRVVQAHAAEAWQQELYVIEDTADKIILPLVINVDDDVENQESSRYVWAVYTENPVRNQSASSELPFLAHYVTMDGEYLYCLETIVPGDTAGTVGFDAVYVFEFMEPVDYTGYVDLSDGTEMELTVTVMRDKRTGMYYLGNIERQIVIADCYQFLYNYGVVQLEYSPDNLEWDQTGLLSLYNYCRAYDYYKAIGWIGGDGLGTPIMVLNNFCDENHNQVNNAAFVGNYLGWSLFAASQANDYSQCLDVIAHEFTHCVTGTVMTYNSYTNDYGAINEGMSDVQGKIAQMMFEPDDSTWVMGDRSLSPVRSMSDPNALGQPAFSWDLYYKPSVNHPTAINDYGGVHTNSSLLSSIAYRLINDGGMTLEEGREYWFAVDCSMVPGTDYKQLADLLPWVMKNLGMDRYMTALEEAIAAVKLGDDTMPDTFEEGRGMITMKLPDNENFNDGNWALQILSVDVDELIVRVKALIEQVKAGDYSQLPQAVMKQFDAASNPQPTPTPVPFDGMGLIADLFSALLGGGSTEVSEPAAEQTEADTVSPEQAADIEEMTQWFREKFGDLFYSDMTAAGQDGLSMYMVCRPGRSFPMLMHMVISDDSMDPDQVVFVFFINGQWFEIPSDIITGSEQDAETSLNYLESEAFDSFVNGLLNTIFESKSLEDFADKLAFRIRSGEIREIPATGLETLVLPEPGESMMSSTDAEPVPARKSRPKTTNE